MTEPRTLGPGIVSDPQISFGDPILNGYGIRTRVVYDRFGAGETVEELARDYDVPSEAIQNAVRWECARHKEPYTECDSSGWPLTRSIGRDEPGPTDD